MVGVWLHPERLDHRTGRVSADSVDSHGLVLPCALDGKPMNKSNNWPSAGTTHVDSLDTDSAAFMPLQTPASTEEIPSHRSRLTLPVSSLSSLVPDAGDRTCHAVPHHTST